MYIVWVFGNEQRVLYACGYNREAVRCSQAGLSGSTDLWGRWNNDRVNRWQTGQTIGWISL